MQPYITYALDLPGQQNIFMLIGADEDSYLYHTYGVDGLPVGNASEIGVYRLALESATTETLHSRIRKAIQEMPATPETMQPGTLTLTFGLVEKEDDQPLLPVFPLNQPLPPATRQFQDAMMEAAREMLRHRYRTLIGKAAWCTSPIAPGDELKFDLSLTNSGIVPLKVANPAAVKVGDDPGLRLHLVKDVPDNELEDQDAGTVDIESHEVMQIDAATDAPVQAPEPIVILDPTEELRLRVHITHHLFLSPGSYFGNVVFTSNEEQIPEHDAVPGRLVAPAGKLQVKIS